MKPFKAKTKTGEKWYVMEGSSLVEVAAADVPGIIERMEAADRAAAIEAEGRSNKMLAEAQATSQATMLAMYGWSTDPSYPNWSRLDY